jgi:adenylyltransferase and sulfurtransferase
VNDAAVLCGKPLVSGSAMRWEGQLTVYHRTPESPCYRCLFPKPPPIEAVGSCNDTGVVGPIPGMIGCLQALETIKVIAHCGELLCGRMLLWNGLTGMFKVIKLRPRQATCAVCGSGATDGSGIQKDLWASIRPEYEMVPCLGPSFDLPKENCASPTMLANHGEDSLPSLKPWKSVILDVREALQHRICHIDGSISMPLRTLARCERPADRIRLVSEAFRKQREERKRSRDDHHEDDDAIRGPCNDEDDVPDRVLVVCRRGIASTAAVKLLVEGQADYAATHQHGEEGINMFASVPMLHVVGGLNRYSSQCDPGFPEY